MSVNEKLEKMEQRLAKIEQALDEIRDRLPPKPKPPVSPAAMATIRRPAISPATQPKPAAYPVARK